MVLKSRSLIRIFNDWTLPIAVFSVLVCSLAFAAQPGYRAFKSWRASSVFETSKELLEKESYRQAFQKAQAAVLLDGRNTEAQRHLATLAVQFGHPYAHRFWEGVLRGDRAVEEDWKYAVDAAFQAQSYETAFDYLRDWKAAYPRESIEFLTRKAIAYSISKNYEAAIAILEQAQQKFPNAKNAKLLFREIVEKVGSPALLGQIAEASLEQAAPDPADLRWIALSRELAPELRAEAIERSLAAAETSTLERIQFIGLGISLGAPQFEKQLAELAQTLDSTRLGELASYTSILADLGRYSEVLALLNEENSHGNRVLQRNLLLSQVETGNIDAALDFTSRSGEKHSTTQAEETIIRAYAYFKLQDRSKFQANSQRAIEQTTPDDAFFVETLLKRAGEAKLLLSLYRQVGTQAKADPAMPVRWLDASIKLAAEEELRESLSFLLSHSIDRLPPKQQALVAYYALVYLPQDSSVGEIAQHLASTYSADPFFRYLLAFSYFQSGQLELARNTLPDLESTPADPRIQLIASAISGNSIVDATFPYLPQEQTLLPLSEARF